MNSFELLNKELGESSTLAIEAIISDLEEFENDESISMEALGVNFDIEGLKEKILLIFREIKRKIREFLSKIKITKPLSKDGYTVDRDGYTIVRQTINYVKQLGPEANGVLKQITKAMKEGEIEIPTPVHDALNEKVIPRLESISEKRSKKTIQIDKKELDALLDTECETVKKAILENFYSAINAAEAELSRLNSKLLKTRFTKRDILIYSQFASRASKYVDMYRSVIGKYETVAVKACIPFRNDK